MHASTHDRPKLFPATRRDANADPLYAPAQPREESGTEKETAMPLMIIRTTANVPEGKVQPLLKECSKKIATLTGKPETYVMTMFGQAQAMTMAGTDEPACFVEVRGVGKMTNQQTGSMSKALCELLSEGLGVQSRRIYLNFLGMEGAMWGWDGSTFG
jgi:phenylpyruvate tautomerase